MTSDQNAGFEPISKVIEALDGAFVVAERSGLTGEIRVRCSSCPGLAGGRYKGNMAAIIAASYHADLDPTQEAWIRTGRTG